MSPASGHAPHTPDRRSSSAVLFGAFRSLTGGRLKSPTPPASVSSATCTPVRTPSAASRHPPESIASASASASDDPVENMAPRHILGPGQAPVGGPPGLEDLVAQVHGTQPFSIRAAAIQKICDIIDNYPVRNLQGLWMTAKDLVSSEQSNNAAEVGYRLLKSCVSCSGLTAVERNVFLQAAMLRSDNACFRLRLEIISILTNGGRNVEDCESHLAIFVLNSIDTCYQASRAVLKSRTVQSKKSPEQPLRETENMALIFQYTIDLCKFNSKVFGEDALEQLLYKTMKICQETTQRADIENSIRLFDTIVTYVHVPSACLKPCLEVLCIIHRQLEDLQEQAWNTLSNLFKSHVGQAAVSALLQTLLDGAGQTSRKYNLYRAIIQILQILLLEDGRGGLPKVPLSLLFPALKASIQHEHKTQESYVISLIAAIMTDERTRNLLLSEGDWSDLIDIVHTCAGRDDDREAALNAAMSERLAGEKAALAFGTGSQTAGNSAAAPSVTSANTGEIEADMFPDAAIAPASTSRNDVARRNSNDNISEILVCLNAISKDVDFVHRMAIMDFFTRHYDRLTDSTAEDTINYHVEARTFHPSNANWLEACRLLVAGILKDVTRPRSLRVLTIKIIRETYNTIESICPSDVVLQCSALLLNNIEVEQDVEVLYELADFAVDVADRASYATFVDVVERLKGRLHRSRIYSPPPTVPPATWGFPTVQSRSIDSSHGSPCNVIASAFVRLFTRSVTKSAPKTRMLYEVLRYIAGFDMCETDARLSALKLLFRLRADSNHALIVNPSAEGESIAAVLCRTEDTAMPTEKVEETPTDHGRSEEHGSWRDQHKASGSSPHSSLNRYTGRHVSTSGRVSKPVPPLWMYPGPSGLPEEPSPQSSRVVFAHIDQEHYPLGDDILDMEVTLWLELIISLMQKASDWDIYSYVLVHLGPQLSNQALVRSCVPQLKMLRNVVCEQIRGSTFREPPSYTLLKRADVAVCMFHILTMLISYHDYYEKSEEDDVVKAFLHGIGKWDRTSVWCIHALTVCCHEMPLSMSKSLDNIVQKMSQIITKPSTAIHILEFLASLARMPELYKNFREEDFKMVFGVSFNYLRHVRDQRERAVAAATNSQNNHRTLRHSGASRDFAASPDHASTRKTKTVEDDLPGYVYTLAHHIITFWFICLKMEERPKHIPWITKNLQYTDSAGKLVLEEQGHVIVDLMNTVAYSDRDETARDPDFAQPGDGEVWKKTWIVGHSLITIETAARSGVSLITSRRPCSSRYLFTKPLLTNPPRHQVPLTVGLASEAWDKSSYVGILPDDIFQTFYAPLALNDPPIELPDDQMTRRALDSFDRTATVDGYSVGVVYIGDGQMGVEHEKEILINTHGSAAYTSFLSDLGTLVRLKGAKLNAHGLDLSRDSDGEYTFCWRDRCMELVFHIPTMMPDAGDPFLTYANKKKHIGNDYVNIYYNDSGIPYDFNTFPSAFNYVAIVISPESRASFVDRRLAEDPEGKSRYYKVQVMSKPGFPDVSPAVEPKILCGKHLAAYCRLLAINASVFSSVWSRKDGGESISSWRNRLRQIKTLRERYGAHDTMALTSPSPVSPVHVQTLSTPPLRENATGFKRTSVATFISEGTNRSSLTGSSHDAAS